MSLHDDELNLIVVETLDPITLKQVIGRARVNRKNPREITVLIPDYSMTDIGNAIASAEQQMKSRSGSGIGVCSEVSCARILRQ